MRVMIILNMGQTTFWSSTKWNFGAWLVVNFLSCPLISTWYQGHDILHEQNYLPLPWQSFSSIFTSFYFLLTPIIFPTNPVLPLPQESFPSSNLLFDENCLSWASFLIFWSRYHHQFLLDIWSCLRSMALVEVVTWSLSIYLFLILIGLVGTHKVFGFGPLWR